MCGGPPQRFGWNGCGVALGAEARGTRRVLEECAWAGRREEEGLLAEAAMLPTMGGARVGDGVGGEDAAKERVVGSNSGFGAVRQRFCSSNWRTSREAKSTSHTRKPPHCRATCSFHLILCHSLYSQTFARDTPPVYCYDLGSHLRTRKQIIHIAARV